MKYTLTIPVSTNTYDLLFGYSLTSWDGAFKFWKINAGDIQYNNGVYSIQPQIETKDVSVPIPSQEGQYKNFSINMSCVDDVYGVKCRWYVLPLCTMDETDLSWIDKASCSGSVYLNATKGFDYTGDTQAKKLEKVAPNKVYYFSELIVTSNIKGIQLTDDSNFTENESITATQILISCTSGISVDYKATGSFTFNVLNDKLYCDDEISLVDVNNNDNSVLWDNTRRIDRTTIKLTVNGNEYTYTSDKIDIVAVKTVPFKDIFDGIVSDEPNEYSINCKIDNSQRGYIPSLNELTPDGSNYKYEDLENNITLLFKNVTEYSNGTNNFICTTVPSFTYYIDSNYSSYLTSLPEYPLIWGIDEESNIAVMSIDSQTYKKSVAPINSDAAAKSHCCAGRQGFVSATWNNYRFG